MTQAAPSPPACTLCKEPTQPGAIKCVKCGGFQGKWFFLNLGVPALGLSVALVSVISLSVALLAPMFEQKNSDVRVSFQYFQKGSAHFVASNGGNRPGTVGEAWIDYIGNSKPERHYLVEDTGNRFVPPAGSRQLSFAIPCEDDFSGIHYQTSEGFGAHPISNNEVVASIVQFNGEREYIKFPIGGLPGIRAINDALSDCLQVKLRGAATAP